MSDKMYSLYGTWTIDDSNAIGTKFSATCSGDYGYNLTRGKEYTVEIAPRILPMSPLCKFTDDNGKDCEGHLERFEKGEVA